MSEILLNLGPQFLIWSSSASMLSLFVVAAAWLFGDVVSAAAFRPCENVLNRLVGLLLVLLLVVVGLGSTSSELNVDPYILPSPSYAYSWRLSYGGCTGSLSISRSFELMKSPITSVFCGRWAFIPLIWVTGGTSICIRLTSI